MRKVFEGLSFWDFPSRLHPMLQSSKLEAPADIKYWTSVYSLEDTGKALLGAWVQGLYPGHLQSHFDTSPQR
jgi:hypothetical protein